MFGNIWNFFIQFHKFQKHGRGRGRGGERSELGGYGYILEKPQFASSTQDWGKCEALLKLTTCYLFLQADAVLVGEDGRRFRVHSFLLLLKFPYFRNLPKVDWIFLQGASSEISKISGSPPTILNIFWNGFDIVYTKRRWNVQEDRHHPWHCVRRPWKICSDVAELGEIRASSAQGWRRSHTVPGHR